MKNSIYFILLTFLAQFTYSQCTECNPAYVSMGLCIIDGGCSESSSPLYSGDDCVAEATAFTNEYCGSSGCTCELALNYDPNAFIDDGSCVVMDGGCSDSTAENYSGDQCSSSTFLAEDCQFGSVELGEFDFTVTDANMTVQVGADVVLFNGEEPPIGSLIGAFFTNDAGELQCAGYQTWSGDQLAIAVWASESGLDNGFAAGESITWGLFIGGQSFAASTSTMNSSPPFSETFISNGFGQLLSADFSGELTAVIGCTDPSAFNFNSDATIDDGSCYSLVWEETNTGSNFTIGVTPDGNMQGENFSILTFNGNEIPVGSYLGVFFTNDNGQYVCGGLEEWTGGNIAIAAWGSEEGLDNGFAIGEEFTLFAQIYGQSFIATNVEWLTTPPFTNTYSLNGFGNILSATFEGEITSTPGCMDDAACNYDLTATVDDGSCTYADGLYDCDGVCYNDSDGDTICDEEDNCPNDAENDADGDGVCESDEINGCTDLNACNYDSTATEDNGTCIQPITWYYDSDGDGLGDDTFTIDSCSQPGPEFVNNINDPCPNDSENDADGDGICESDEINGCTELNACNYDSEATDDDASCEYISCLDECGVPNGDNSTCLDECGVPNGDNSTCLDQCGIPNGDNSTCLDECGVPNGDNSTCLDECGIPNGDNSTCLDECGVPNGDDSTCLDECGVPNGDNSTCLDECGVPNGDDSTCLDECGVPNGDNSTCLDECGVINGDNSSCTGCADSSACNFIGSTIDDGSCEYPEEGYDCLGELLPVDSPWGNNLGCDPFNNHTVAFNVTENIEIGDYVGLFYTDENGNLVFSQGTEYLGDIFYFTVCGDDETTEEKDGFTEGEEFIWQIYSNGLDCSLPLSVNYNQTQPTQGFYSANGISEVIGLSYDELTLELVVVDVDCNGQDNGLITALVSGGSGNYNYEWSTGEINSAIPLLSPGIYSVIVSDENGCMIEESQIEISEPEEIIISSFTTNVSCNGAFDGSIDLDISGGTGDYSFYWSNGQTTEDIFDIGAGIYSVIVTDSNLCSQTADFEIIEPDAMSISENHFNVSCNGFADASIDITVSGGVGDYTYSWSNGQSIEDISSLTSGTYLVTATDENECSVSIEIEITEPEELSISFSSLPGEYSDCNSGQLSVLVENGTGPYIYSWNNGETTSSIFGLCAGDYSVTVTDANSCTISASSTVDLLIPDGWEVSTTNFSNSQFALIDIPADANLLFDGVDINIGDFIGVFYVNESGGLSCGGYTVWEGLATSIFVIGPNYINLGFENGEQYQWKIYNGENQSGFAIYDTVNYNSERYFFGDPDMSGVFYNIIYDNYGDVETIYGINLYNWLIDNLDDLLIFSYETEDFGPNGGFPIGESYSLLSVSGIEGAIFSSYQSIPLNENPYTDWDMISTYMNSNNDVESIMSPILNNFIIIKDASGLVYWPAIPVSTLDNLNTQEAYAIKTWAPEEISISGDFVQPEFTSNQWAEGWNFISYPRYWSNSVETSLSTVLSDIKLLKDDSGNIFWPELGINTMSNMEAGEGYLLKLNIGYDFSFDSNSDYYPENPFDAIAPGGSISSEVGARYGSDIENFELPVTTYLNMTIGFPVSSLNVEDGDELAVFDQLGNLVGVSKLKSGNNYIVVWGDDEETIDKDGLLVDEKMIFKLWKKQEDKIFIIIPQWSEGGDNFSVNGINIAESVNIEFTNKIISSINCYPNPASSFVNIEFSIENDSKLDISLVDNLGKLVYNNSSSYNSGISRINLPLDNVSKGIYYIEVRGVDFVERIKLDVL